VPRILACGPLLFLLTVACGEVEAPTVTEGDSDTGTDSTTDGPSGGTTTTPGSTSESPDSSTSSPDPITTGEPVTTEPDPTDGPVATSTTTDATTTTGDGTSTTDTSTTGLDPVVPELPVPSADCPDIVDGEVSFHPSGLDSPRDVRIWVDLDAAEQADGPVVFYWHGTGGSPQEALTGIGELGIQEILDLGGIVIAPTHDPMAGIFPWWLVLSETQDDLLLADEVLACAKEQIGVDASRIYTLGFSAGGLNTAHMSIRRSSYIAAAAPYSGGLIFGAMPAFQDPDNKFAAMIFHGGPGDVVVVGFEQASKDYAAYLDGNDDFNFLCNHGGGHSIPDAQDSVMQFFFDHPFGVGASPYAQGLPGGFPDYCAL
jgi:predicted esterase